MNGKGSKKRPSKVSSKTLEKNWKRTFDKSPKDPAQSTTEVDHDKSRSRKPVPGRTV